MAAAILTRYGYPKVPGDQNESIIDVSGPVNYDPLVPGASWPPPPADVSGGQIITAQDFGLQFLHFVFGMASTDGEYFVLVVPNMVEPLPNPPLPTQLPDGTFSSFRLGWYTTQGSGQASGDISHSTVRLFARGG